MTPIRPSCRPLTTAALALAVLTAASSLPAAEAAPASPAFADVGAGYRWARNAIEYVAKDRGWMNDFGDTEFRPGAKESRKLLARALVRAFAGGGVTPDPAIQFSDLQPGDPLWDEANIAVSQGWMQVDGGAFHPNDPVTIHTLYEALIRTLPLDQEVRALRTLTDAGGYAFKVPRHFPTTLLGMRLGFRYNHARERDDVVPSDSLPRAEVAYALWMRATLDQWEIDAMSTYRNLNLPALGAPMRKVVEFGMRYVGYPYIWGGEWHKKRPGQPTGGFDCSGLMWWTVKRPDTGYDNKRIRGYAGWRLPQRTSADMAARGRRIGLNAAEPGDLLFYDGNGDGRVDHVDLYLGNGWALDSSSGIGGTTIVRVSNGWYRDHFEHARRIM